MKLPRRKHKTPRPAQTQTTSTATPLEEPPPPPTAPGGRPRDPRTGRYIKRAAA